MKVATAGVASFCANRERNGRLRHATGDGAGNGRLAIQRNGDRAAVGQRGHKHPQGLCSGSCHSLSGGTVHAKRTKPNIANLVINHPTGIRCRSCAEHSGVCGCCSGSVDNKNRDGSRVQGTRERQKSGAIKLHRVGKFFGLQVGVWLPCIVAGSGKIFPQFQPRQF